MNVIKTFFTGTCFIRTLAALLGTAVSLLAFAADDKSAPKWEADVATGLVFERGNTVSNGLNGNFNATRESQLWGHTIKAEGSNKEDKFEDPAQPGEKSYVRTDERYYALYKLDRKLGEGSPNYLFNVLTYEKDAFSGFHYQATYALGLGRRWVDTEKHTLDAEAGPGYRWQCLENQDGYFSCERDEDEGIFRVAMKYKWVISDSADFRQEVSSDIGADSRSTRAESILNSKINSSFSLRVRYLLEHQSEVAPSIKESDHEFTVGLTYTF